MTTKELIARALIEIPLNQPRKGGQAEQSFIKESTNLTLQQLAKKMLDSGFSAFCADLPGDVASKLTLRFVYDCIIEWSRANDVL